MNDRDILTDCLNAEKLLAHEYVTATDHTDDPGLLQTLMNIATDEQLARLQIYQAMNQRGWYNPNAISPQQVQQSAQQFQQVQQQLQQQIGANS